MRHLCRSLSDSQTETGSERSVDPGAAFRVQGPCWFEGLLDRVRLRCHEHGFRFALEPELLIPRQGDVVFLFASSWMTRVFAPWTAFLRARFSHLGRNLHAPPTHYLILRSVVAATTSSLFITKARFDSGGGSFLGSRCRGEIRPRCHRTNDQKALEFPPGAARGCHLAIQRTMFAWN